MMLGRMFLLLFLGFLLEGWVLVRVASATSFGFTFVLCLFTFFIGLSLLRSAALRIQYDTQRAMAAEGSISGALAGGFAQILAGLLLIMPGVISDVVGALIMLPPLHGFALKRIRASKLGQSGQFPGMRFGRNFGAGGPQTRPGASSSRTTGGEPRPDGPPSFRDAAAPPPEDNYMPPRVGDPDSIIIDGEIVDD